MITQRKINIPIFDYKLTIIIADTLEEARNKLPDRDIDLNGTKAITFSNKSIGGAIVLIRANSQSSAVHESIHIKNSIWEYIGYQPQASNDEVDAYLVTYI